MLHLVDAGVRGLSLVVFLGAGAFEVLSNLFSDGPLSLRADSSGKPKLPGFDSRLNLVRSFAASGWY
ncbi:hypothetical protein Bca4012_045772 [Brassica carinata]|uniref:Uncharacterized protein n=1 Tax=Brassica carinata TaxID=52824 RepID=A0A8X7QTQ0_BRACI|nr:hypothetical protein Bca52824_056083 [Brassica carinata]